MKNVHKDFICIHCSPALQFDRSLVYVLHLKLVHGINNRSKTIENHQEKSFEVDNNGLKCELCSKNFTAKSSLKAHVASVHDGEKPLKCEICDYSCSRNTSLKKHVASVHDGKKPFKCEICDDQFELKHELNEQDPNEHCLSS